MSFAIVNKVTTINLASEKSITIGSEDGIQKMTVQATSANSTTITGSGKIISGGLEWGGDGIVLTEDSSPLTITATAGATLSGITITNAASATCVVILLG